ncbi:winged helix-turn-helix transcriptional regulator [Novispirillum itersonii]|uniref:winged helix-turn-helix transcriptional regulator n=1 Tax=Novispirillum itersonii TaxID=189 RepID=UPI00035D68F6|nr:helix-turn-helix domain-containing protein [Novispirillum itersonii]
MALKLRKNNAPAPPNMCPLSHCMSLLGGAWTPNIIWYLSGGPRRFSELRHDIPAISAKMLSTRLRDLEDRAIVIRQVMPTSPPSVEYSLTPLGRELLPAIQTIAEIGHKLKVQAQMQAAQNAANAAE